MLKIKRALNSKKMDITISAAFKKNGFRMYYNKESDQKYGYNVYIKDTLNCVGVCFFTDGIFCSFDIYYGKTIGKKSNTILEKIKENHKTIKPFHFVFDTKHDLDRFLVDLNQLIKMEDEVINFVYSNEILKNKLEEAERICKEKKWFSIHKEKPEKSRWIGMHYVYVKTRVATLELGACYFLSLHKEEGLLKRFLGLFKKDTPDNEIDFINNRDEQALRGNLSEFFCMFKVGVSKKVRFVNSKYKTFKKINGYPCFILKTAQDFEQFLDDIIPTISDEVKILQKDCDMYDMHSKEYYKNIWGLKLVEQENKSGIIKCSLEQYENYIKMWGLSENGPCANGKKMSLILKKV